jgi:uncharacterized membrane protein YhaH (DUF805 family)
MMMDGFGLWQFLVAIFWIVAISVPIVKILQRTGHSGWWCILAFIPLLNLLALWLFAYARWPGCDGLADPDRRMA